MNLTCEICFSYSHGPNTRAPMHTHSFYEFVYYYRGSGTSETPNGTINYRAGDIILYAPKVPHDETHLANTDVFCIQFKPDEPIDVPPGVYNDPDGQILRHVDKIRTESEDKLPYYQDVIESHVARLIVLLARRAPQGGIFNEGNEMRKIASLVRENLPYIFNVQALAKSSGYSYDYFRHVFKRHIGMSPKEYLDECRTKQAKMLLETGSLKIAEISERCGFKTQEHFSLFFKKQTGLAPLDYRRIHGGDR